MIMMVYGLESFGRAEMAAETLLYWQLVAFKDTTRVPEGVGAAQTAEAEALTVDEATVLLLDVGTAVMDAAVELLDAKVTLLVDETRDEAEELEAPEVWAELEDWMALNALESIHVVSNDP